MNIRDTAFLTLGLMGASVAVRYACGLDPWIVSIARPILAQMPVIGSLCTALHGAAEATMNFSGAGLMALGAYQLPPGSSDPGTALALILMAALATFFVMPSLVMSTFAAASGKLAIFCAGANIALAATYFTRPLLLGENEVCREGEVVAGALHNDK